MAPSLTAAEPPKASPGALDTFFELGLPDSRQAKWVRAMVDGERTDTKLLSKEGKTLEGNAWLVREEGKGRVTLILAQTRVIHALRQKGGNEDDEPAPGAEPAARIQPADLKADLALLLEGLDAQAEENKKPQGEHDSSADQRSQSTGMALLFLAHLRRQGRPEVETLFPKALASAAPQEALDAAVNSLAEARLAELNDRWVRAGDIKAYAAGLEALAAQFHRGWTNRGGVLLLAGRLRAEPAAAAKSPAADLLRGLRPADLDKLPLESNWILPEAEPAGDEEPSPRRMRVIHGRIVGGPPGKPTAGGSPVEAFFKQRVQAASQLVPLLARHDPLRLLHGGNGYRSSRGFSYMMRHQSSEDAARSAYEAMLRPYEMGELAKELLQATMPGRQSVSSGDEEEEGGTPALAAWVKSLEGKSEEELAWLYLRSAESSGDPVFHSALELLLKQGSPETFTKLREVFFDPAVWEEGAIEALGEPLKRYLEKLGPEAEGFREKLLATVKAELAAPKGESAGDEQYAKMLATQRAQQFRQLEQLLRPRTLATLLAEFVEAKEEEAATLLEAIGLAARENRGEAEKQLLQAAVKLKGAELRGQLLGLLLPGRGPDPTAKTPPPAPLDAASLAAAKELLADESMAAALQFGPSASVAEQTVYALLYPRLPSAQQQAWQELAMRAASVAEEWARTAASAMVDGQPIPPVPAGPNLKKEEVSELANQWAALSGEQVLAAVKALPPARQVGLIGALAAASKWEDPFVRAQLIVATVKPDPAFPAAAEWKGRTFDDKLRDELADRFREPALAGQQFVISLSARHPLAGLTLTVKKVEQKFPRAQFDQLAVPGLEGRPPPDAMVAGFLTLMRAQESALAATPLWKDAAITQAWAEANKTPASVPEPAKPAARSRNSRGERKSNPAALAALLKRLVSGDADVLTAFNFALYAAPLGSDSEP